MSEKFDLVGKTISGVVATAADAKGAQRIWMLQFTDGTHVEFVSPAARRQLERLAGHPQLPLRHALCDARPALNPA